MCVERTVSDEQLFPLENRSRSREIKIISDLVDYHVLFLFRFRRSHETHPIGAIYKQIQITALFIGFFFLMEFT